MYCLQAHLERVLNMLDIGRLRFRPLNRQDLHKLLEWENRYEVTLYSRGEPMVFKNKEQVERRFDEYLEDDKKERLIVELLEDEKAIGIATFKDRSKDIREASIGTYIGEKDYWDKGLGKEICLGLLEILFFQKNYERLSAWSSSVNKRAHKVLNAFGFKLSGRARKSGYLLGKRIDWYMFDLLREEYMPKRSEYLKKYLDDPKNYLIDYCHINDNKHQ